MNNINKQLETILSKLSNISTFTSSAFLDAWWEDNADKAKIEDVINISGATGVLQNDTVDSANIVDESITYDKLNSEGLDWNIINSNPTGSSETDTYQDAPRVFSARGSGFIPLYNSLATVTKASPSNDIYYTALGANPTGTYSDGILLPIDMLYDNTNKVLRYPTLRFDLLFYLNLPASSGILNYIKLMFTEFADYSGRCIVDGDFSSKILAIDSASDYYTSGSSIQTKNVSFNTAEHISHIFISGEINIDKDSFITSEMNYFMANLQSLDDNTINLFSYSSSEENRTNLHGNILLLPEFTINSTVAGSEISIIRQSYSLVNKKLDNDGWAISKRYSFTTT